MEAVERPVFDAKLPAWPAPLDCAYGTLRFEGDVSGRHEFPLPIVRGLNATYCHVKPTPESRVDDIVAVYKQGILDIHTEGECWIMQALSMVPCTYPGLALGGFYCPTKTFPVDENFRAFLELAEPVHVDHPIGFQFVAHRPEWGRQNPFANGERWDMPLPAPDGGKG